MSPRSWSERRNAIRHCDEGQPVWVGRRHGDILSALAEVAEDKLSNVDVRLDACRALSGCLVGRVYSSGRLRKRILGNFDA